MYASNWKNDYVKRQYYINNRFKTQEPLILGEGTITSMMVGRIGSACRWAILNRIHVISILTIAWFLVIGISGLCCAQNPSGASPISKVGCQLVCDEYDIALDGYDSQSDSTEFRYQVSAESGTCGLNHWLLELPSCINSDDILEAGPGSWEYVESAGIRGIKFEFGIEQPESGEAADSVGYYLRLKGPDWSLKQMPEMRAVIMIGTETCDKKVEVPGCPVPS